MRAFWSTIVDCRKSLPDKGGRDVLGERVAEYAWPGVSLFSWYLTIFILLDYTFWLRNKGLAGAALLCLIIWVNLHFNAALRHFPPPMERAEFPCCGVGEKKLPPQWPGWKIYWYSSLYLFLVNPVRVCPPAWCRDVFFPATLLHDLLR